MILVAETGFEPVTFGNRVSVHSQHVSNIRKKPILWALRLNKISKAAHSLTSKCHSKLDKYLTYTAELLPSRSISEKKSFTKKITQKFNNCQKFTAELLPSSQFKTRSIK